ncbi:MAG: hypothetical protein M1829_004706 [Trizodia sp. TS-e1964]|nr:MAG: hypothetical protein M1829_004706 [Trizodia sp. TS-e1964]
MPYNTRRKSLSLPSLGIHLPQSHAARAQARSPPTAATTTIAEQQTPNKRVKRSHASTSPTPPSPKSSIKTERRKSASKYGEHTPPPSPGPALESKIDTQGINDTIVVAVIELLEKTGNKPHLVKDLAARLSTSISIVESSANPHAIVSSRLNAYLKRPWTPLSPCPLAKVLYPTHPRRIYFFLTTSPHQPIPEGDDAAANLNARRGVISPSLSSEDGESRKRMALSPSPEIDLSPPDLEDVNGVPSVPGGGSFGGPGVLLHDNSNNLSSVNIAHNHRAASPPLEGDEREFTQTASNMQKRGLGQRDAQVANAAEDNNNFTNTNNGDDGSDGISIANEEVRPAPIATVDETEESAQQRNHDTATALFGHSVPSHLMRGVTPIGLSSPDVRSMNLQITTTSIKHFSHAAHELMDVDGQEFADWDTAMMSPENVELSELDALLGGF